jgi:hypothetical protein
MFAHTGFYLFYEGKPCGEKPSSSAGYNCLRAFTFFCVNSQRVSISEAPAETGGGGLLPVKTLPLPLPHEALRASSGSRGFLRPGTACCVVPGTVGSIGLRASRSVVAIRNHIRLYGPGPF